MYNSLSPLRRLWYLAIVAVAGLGGCNGIEPDPPLDPSLSGIIRAVPDGSRAVAYLSTPAALSDMKAFAAALDADMLAVLDSVEARLGMVRDRTGIDPATDLKDVMLVLVDRGAELAVARGSFDAGAIIDSLDAALPDSFVVRREEDRTIWVASGEHRPIALAVVPPDMLFAAGSELALQTALDQLAAPAVERTDALADRVAAVSSGTGWAVVREIPDLPDGTSADGELDERMLGALRAVRHVAVEGQIVGNVANGSAVLWPRFGIDPEDLADLVEGIRAAVLLRTDLPAAVRTQVEDVSVRTEGDRVRVSASMTAETLRSIGHR